MKSSDSFVLHKNYLNPRLVAVLKHSGKLVTYCIIESSLTYQLCSMYNLWMAYLRRKIVTLEDVKASHVN